MLACFNIIVIVFFFFLHHHKYIQSCVQKRKKCVKCLIFLSLTTKRDTCASLSLFQEVVALKLLHRGIQKSMLNWKKVHAVALGF